MAAKQGYFDVFGELREGKSTAANLQWVASSLRIAGADKQPAIILTGLASCSFSEVFGRERNKLADFI